MARRPSRWRCRRIALTASRSLSPARRERSRGPSPGSYRCSLDVGTSVLSIDLFIIALLPRKHGVEGSARVGEDGTCLGDLVCIAKVADLAGSHPHPAHLTEQRTEVVVDRGGHLLPGRTQLLAALVDVGAPRVGQHVHAPVAERFGAYQALVLELSEGRVDRAWAWPPDAVGALLDLLHDLVAVQRSLREQQQGCSTDV